MEKELLWAVITSNSQYDWVAFVSFLFYNQVIYEKVICSRSNDLSTTDPELIPGLWFKLLCSIYHTKQLNYLFHLSQHDFIYAYMNSIYHKITLHRIIIYRIISDLKSESMPSKFRTNFQRL